MPDTAFIYSDELSHFEYSDDHPFKPLRARNTMELCNRHGLLHAVGVSRPEPEPADEATLRRFHTEEYLAMLARAGRLEHDIEMLAAGLGTPDCPLLPDIDAFCRGVVGATMLAVEQVRDGTVARAFNPVGGMHHGAPDHAEGFCYVNDVAIALTHLRALGLRTAFVDIDAHHANGVQDAFYDDDRVLVISLHEFEEGFYPGTGRAEEIGSGAGEGFTANLPLAARTDDEVYLAAFEQVVPPLLEAFAPDLVLAEIGADTMISDPLTHLRLTSNGYEAVVKRLCDAAPRLTAVGGGGYDVYRTANCWTLAFGALCEIEPEDEFAGLVGGMMYGSAIGGLRDPEIRTEGPDKEHARAVADESVRVLQAEVFPRLGARVP